MECGVYFVEWSIFFKWSASKQPKTNNELRDSNAALGLRVLSTRVGPVYALTPLTVPFFLTLRLFESEQETLRTSPSGIQKA